MSDIGMTAGAADDLTTLAGIRFLRGVRPAHAPVDAADIRGTPQRQRVSRHPAPHRAGRLRQIAASAQRGQRDA
ncbi:MAG: hypothetical protein HND48_21860 [Chloroflexi bacterium]|nr:hypothetical protein [Chloroflexota bacterium]